jgi:hypothetical protein
MSISVAVLIAVAIAAFLCVRMLRRVRKHSVLWLSVAGLWSGAIAAIVFLDVNIPLSESHLRPSGSPAPLWLAISATYVRLAALASIFVAQQILQQPIEQPNNRLQPIARKTRPG